MKNTTIIFFLFFPALKLMCMNEVPSDYKQQARKIEIECCDIMDKIFAHMQTSLEDKQDIITLEWLKREEIQELQYAISNGIVLSFDNNSKNIIPDQLESYLQTKIRQQAEKLFEDNEVTPQGMKQFFYMSKIMCGLSQGCNCDDMISVIKKENAIPMLKLKIQEKVYRYEKKEEMRQLCKNIIGGLLPR